MISARQAALNTLQQVVYERRSLNHIITAKIAEADKALYHTLVYDVLRNYRALSAVRDRLLSKPLHANAQIPAILLNLGIWQLLRMHLGDHGVIHETVALTERNGCARTKGLINAVLRRVQRERPQWQEVLTQEEVRNIPTWLAARYDAAECASLARSASYPPPFTLRLHPALDKSAWLSALNDAELPSVRDNPLSPQAVTLAKSCPVNRIPAFADGYVSVQDAAAQQAALLLRPQNGERIVDACAAPGGKTGHILELAPEAQVLALDQDESRLARVHENLARLRGKAEVRHADAADIKSWYDGKPFDAVLLDAPCSGSGVLRRHPDIAWLREAEDLRRLPQTQSALLAALWQTLKPGGRLLYTTCSLLPDENQAVIKRFLAKTPDAALLPVSVPQARDTGFGSLHLPSADGDGFFYALLGKAA